MMRGDFVTIAVQGDFGKPRPALVIQADQYRGHSTVTVLLVTSTVIDTPLLRITVEPDAINGLQKVSQVMIDKVMTVKLDKVGNIIGCIRAETLMEVERCLAVFLGIAK